MNSYDEKRSIVWMARDTDDPTGVEEGQVDSQAKAEELARQRGLPFVVGYTLITYSNDEDDWEFDEEAEPIFVRLPDVPLLTDAERARKFEVRTKCLGCPFEQVFASNSFGDNQRAAMDARDVHLFEHGGHFVAVQKLSETRWATIRALIGEDGTIEFPSPEEFGLTAMDISQ
jgi:hypothetical protein